MWINEVEGPNSQWGMYSCWDAGLQGSAYCNHHGIGYKNFENKFWRLEINIGQILMIQYNLESGERDLSNGDIGFRV